MFKLGIRCMSYTLPGQFIKPEAPKGVKGFVEPAELYKPSQKLVFDRKGELLVFEANTIKNFSVFFPIPWSLGTWSVPIGVWQMISGNLPVNTWSILALYFAVVPHFHYLYNLRYTINKIWYIRGGHWKLELRGMGGLIITAYSSPDNLDILQGGELSENGDLLTELKLNSSVWTEFYEDKEDQVLKVPNYGKVVNPEIFAAMLKKLKVDDSDFVVDHKTYLA